MHHAGRPQFDTSATAVIMTQTPHVARYQNLTAGHQLVESRLHATLAEFLNAEVAMRVVTTLDQARMWLRSTFYWVRVLQNPAFYNVQAPQMSAAQREQLVHNAAHVHLNTALAKLDQHGLLRVDQQSGSITPLDPGTCVSNPEHDNTFGVKVHVTSHRLCVAHSCVAMRHEGVSAFYATGACRLFHCHLLRPSTACNWKQFAPD